MKYVEFSLTFSGFQYRRSSESLDLQFNLYLACTECTYVCMYTYLDRNVKLNESVGLL